MVSAVNASSLTIASLRGFWSVAFSSSSSSSEEGGGVRMMDPLDSPALSTVVWSAVTVALLVWISTGCGIVWHGRFALYFTTLLPSMVLLVLAGAVLRHHHSSAMDALGRWSMEERADELSSSSSSSSSSTSLYHSEMWFDALTQALDGVAVGRGVMVAYGSYIPSRMPAQRCCSTRRGWSVPWAAWLVTCLGIVYTLSLAAAHFAAVGGYAESQQLVDWEDLPIKGKSTLIFVAWPVALQKWGSYGPGLFYFHAALLGIGTVSALCRSLLTSLTDLTMTVTTSSSSSSSITTKGRSTRRSGFFSYTLWSLSVVVPVVTLGGLVDMVDNLPEVLDALLEGLLPLSALAGCWAVGWFYGMDRQIDAVGWRAAISSTATPLLAVTSSTLLWMAASNAAAAFTFGVIYFCGLAVTAFFTVLNDKDQQQQEEQQLSQSQLSQSQQLQQQPFHDHGIQLSTPTHSNISYSHTTLENNNNINNNNNDDDDDDDEEEDDDESNDDYDNNDLHRPQHFSSHEDSLKFRNQYDPYRTNADPYRRPRGKQPQLTPLAWRAICRILSVDNLDDLAQHWIESGGYIPGFGVWIKHCLPMILLIRFVVWAYELAYDDDGEFAPLYRNSSYTEEIFPMFPHQFVAYLLLVAVIALFALGLVCPSLYECSTSTSSSSSSHRNVHNDDHTSDTERNGDDTPLYQPSVEIRHQGRTIRHANHNHNHNHNHNNSDHHVVYQPLTHNHDNDDSDNDDYDDNNDDNDNEEDGGFLNVQRHTNNPSLDKHYFHSSFASRDKPPV